jgi:hypothetical protein
MAEKAALLQRSAKHHRVTIDFHPLSNADTGPSTPFKANVGEFEVKERLKGPKNDNINLKSVADHERAAIYPMDYVEDQDLNFFDMNDRKVNLRSLLPCCISVLLGATGLTGGHLLTNWIKCCSPNEILVCFSRDTIELKHPQVFMQYTGIQVWPKVIQKMEISFLYCFLGPRVTKPHFLNRNKAENEAFNEDDQHSFIEPLKQIAIVLADKKDVSLCFCCSSSIGYLGQYFISENTRMRVKLANYLTNLKVTGLTLLTPGYIIGLRGQRAGLLKYDPDSMFYTVVMILMSGWIFFWPFLPGEIPVFGSAVAKAALLATRSDGHKSITRIGSWGIIWLALCFDFIVLSDEGPIDNRHRDE